MNEKSLWKYEFTAEQLAYVESHSNFTLRDMANVLDWIESLDEPKRAKVDALNLAQVAVFKLSDEARHEFFGGGRASYLEFLENVS